MKMSNSDIAKILMSNDHLSKEDKQVLLKILGEDEGLVREKPSLNGRIADSLTNFIGSWSFIIISLSLILIWMLLNSIILPEQYIFDEFPFVLLNLVLACIAAIQSPIIMMSQNRQDKRESLKTQSDYEIDLKTIVIIQDLYAKVINLCENMENIVTKLDAGNDVKKPSGNIPLDVPLDVPLDIPLDIPSNNKD